MPTLHQFVPTLDPGAVGSHILAIQTALRGAGWQSDVFSEHTKAPYDGLALRFTDYGKSVAAHDDDIVVYHAAIGSSVADWLLSRQPPRLVVDYHNITPPAWFEPWEPDLAYGLGWGRAQLRRLGRRALWGLADSTFNETELRAVGFRRTDVLPILVPPGEPADERRVEQLRAEPGDRWIFVGRLAPNKRQHLLIAALAVYRKAYDPRAGLTLVGGASSPAYEKALRRYAADLGLGDAVMFRGSVSDGERNASYAAADVFVCLSGHEGFCVPLLEAWERRVPVVAYDAGAVAETMGAGGILLRTTSPVVVAATVARVCADAVVADALRAEGARRLAVLSPAHAAERLLALATSMLDARARRAGDVTAAL